MSESEEESKAALAAALESKAALAAALDLSVKEARHLRDFNAHVCKLVALLGLGTRHDVPGDGDCAVYVALAVLGLPWSLASVYREKVIGLLRSKKVAMSKHVRELAFHTSLDESAFSCWYDRSVGEMSRNGAYCEDLFWLGAFALGAIEIAADGKYHAASFRDLIGGCYLAARQKTGDVTLEIQNGLGAFGSGPFSLICEVPTDDDGNRINGGHWTYAIQKNALLQLKEERRYV